STSHSPSGNLPAHSLPGRGPAPRSLLAAGGGDPGELRPRQSKEVPDELPLGESARWACERKYGLTARFSSLSG
ncbi:unnamed protein product, partial [Urochloa humidicola]